MTQLSALQVGAYAYQAGFRDTDLILAIAYAGIESGFDPNAVSPTGCIGLWQICGTQLTCNLYDPLCNAKAAYAKWKGAGGTFDKDWTPYDGGSTNPSWNFYYAEAESAAPSVANGNYSGPSGTGASGGSGTSSGSSAQTAQVSSDNGCATTMWSVPLPGGSSVCLDGFIGGLSLGLGFLLTLGGLAVITAFALSKTKAGQQATQALGAVGGPVAKVATSAVAAQKSGQKEIPRQPTPEQAQRASQRQQDALHKQRMQRAQLRGARARARTAEQRARGGSARRSSDVAKSAREKAAAGRFSDFTPEEIRYAQRNQE